MADTALYRGIWRWHFYAGLFVLPFILILSLTGAIYLFKPQIDSWEERDFQGLGTVGAVSADTQLTAALEATPGGKFNHYRLPSEAGDAAMIQLTQANGAALEVYVSPQGEVLGSLDPQSRISAIIAKFHGSLMLGKWGDRLVELAASWTIVMILTGLFLWWPRPFKAAGTFWPRLSLRGRPLMKDLHRVTGIWISALVLVMLASGLPWAGTWGSAFNWTRAELGLVQDAQEWKIGAEETTTAPANHGAHVHGESDGLAQFPGEIGQSLPLSHFVGLARAEGLAFPALVIPPNSPQRFGPPTGDEWTAKSQAQNRTLNRTVTYDKVSGEETARSGFGDKHAIDRAVGYGIAWHEGQLFGIANQIMGLLTAIALIFISVLGVVMWLKRKPQGQLAAPERTGPIGKPQVYLGLAVLMILLPLFGLSVIMLFIIDRSVTSFTNRAGVGDQRRNAIGAQQ
jgi:uncharacterized iron-regulated membrane protein